MNKLVICLLVAVCLLGFALILLNQKMGTDVPVPVVAEKAQPTNADEEQKTVTQLHPTEQTDKTETLISDSESKTVSDMAPSTLETVPKQSESSQTETVNKGLDEVLSERAAEVHAPSQQASIVQQSSVADLVVETPQLPKMATAIPIIPEPQTVDPNVVQTLEPTDGNVNPKNVSGESQAKKHAEKLETPAKKESPNGSDTSKKKELEPQKTVKNSTDDKAENSKTAQPAKAKAQGVTLFTVFTRENGATVRLRTNAPLPYSLAQMQNPKALVKELQKPDRVMFDLTGVWDIKEPAVPKNLIVDKVRVGKMADRTRIVVDLKDKPKKIRVKIAEKKDGIDIFLDR